MTQKLLRAFCARRYHVLVTVVCDDDGDLWIEAPKYARGRDYATWTAARFRLRRGSGHRYGCACKESVFITDNDLLTDVDAGHIGTEIRRDHPLLD